MLGGLKRLHSSSNLNCLTAADVALQGSEKTPITGGFRKLCKQPKYLYFGAMAIALTFLLSSVLLSEQPRMGSFIDRITGSFKTSALVREFKSTTEKCHNVTREPCHVTREQCTRGGEELPKGMVVPTTDLQMRSLAVENESQVQKKMTKNLLAMAVGIKQKEVVDKIVQKFPLTNFTIMLFHYDGVVEQWNDLPWSNQSIHIVALQQTKWWFAKRFMHPDIVAQYNYVFLWDEDLGVENFHAARYLTVMEAAGLEISQPALDPNSQDIHHGITRRRSHSTAHKRYLVRRGTTKCTKESNGPPCTGFVEVMAPVFSRAAWRCIWYMIQNDLVHGWGIDFKIGYCAQGVRSEKVGVIDAEYVLHKGIPSLGGPHITKDTDGLVMTAEMMDCSRFLLGRMQSILKKSNDTPKKRGRNENGYDLRSEVRRRSGQEMFSFLRRWKKAVEEDATWEDPYKPMNDSSGNYHLVR